MNTSILNTKLHWTLTTHCGWENFIKRIETDEGILDIFTFDLFSIEKITLWSELWKSNPKQNFHFSRIWGSSRLVPKFSGVLEVGGLHAPLLRVGSDGISAGVRSHKTRKLKRIFKNRIFLSEKMEFAKFAKITFGEARGEFLFRRDFHWEPVKSSLYGRKIWEKLSKSMKIYWVLIKLTSYFVNSRGYA